MQSISMIIDGQAVSTPDQFPVINPATATPFAQAAIGHAGHVDAAVAAARRAFPAWAGQPAASRSALLHRLAAALEAELPVLVAMVTRESGKPLQGLNGVGAGAEVGGAVAWTHYTADLSLPDEVVQDDEQVSIQVTRKPLGVVASITPWNWPLLIAVWHIMPALQAGNTVVIKPSEYTPVATARLVEIAQKILPPGVLNLLTGPQGSEVGPALAAHPDVAKVVFTGSTPTGRRIMAGAAPTLKRLTLELGGNDAGIVLPESDVATLAPRLFAAAFHNNGQTCTALKRLYVHESLYEPLGKALADIARRVVVADGMTAGCELGPVQNAAQLAIVEAIAADARARGGRFLCGGERRPGPGYFYLPTLVADLAEGSRLVDEEPFGPILPIIRYQTVDEAISRANASPYGLGASVWGSDLIQASQVARRLESGTAWVNDHATLQPNTPFGGVKQSGIGVAFGLHGLAEYTTIQTLRVVKT